MLLRRRRKRGEERGRLLRRNGKGDSVGFTPFDDRLAVEAPVGSQSFARCGRDAVARFPQEPHNVPSGGGAYPLVTTLRAAPHYEFGVVNLAMALPLTFNEA